MRDWIKLILLAIGVIAVWLFSSIWIDRYVVPQQPWLETRAAAAGLFGDKFGAVNALFSGLAFAGIIFTILMQRRELELQRHEIQRNREQLGEQNRVLSRQRFEGVFFKLLELQANLVARVEFLGSTGLRAFSDFQVAVISADREFQIYRALSKLDREKIRTIRDINSVPSADQESLTPADVSTLSDALTQIPRSFDSFLDDDIEMHRNKIKAAYEKAAGSNLEYFAHYFRSIYHLLQLIENAQDLTELEQSGYAKMLRSQLSDVELICLFYNCLMPYEVRGREMELGHPKLGDLLVKYDVLHNLNEADVIHRTHHAVWAASYGERIR